MPQSVAFIGRQPLLDRAQHIIGYELFFRSKHNPDSASDLKELQADTDVLSNTLNNMGTHWLIGQQLAFINVGECMLMSDFIELLPARRVVLDIAPNISLSTSLLERLQQLRSNGFSIALDHFEFDGPHQGLLELASYVKLDAMQPAKLLEQQAARLRSYPVTKVAERVETYEHFHLCRELGFDVYQGFYFSRPETLSTRVIHPSMSNTLELLNLLRQDAPPQQLEEILKRDVALSFKLLRFVNSAAAGFNSNISSFNHAIAVIGYQHLYRWLTLLLITTSPCLSVSPALQKSAIFRARLLELIGIEQNLPLEMRDNLFVVGMFSWLEVLFDMPMARVLEHVQLATPLRQALLTHTGPYATQLNLALACQEQDFERITAHLKTLNLSLETLNRLQNEALAWSEALAL